MHETAQYLNNAPSIFFRWKNSEGWPVLYVSQNVNTLFDATDEDFMNGKVVYKNFIHPSDIARVIKEVTEASISTLAAFKHEPYRIKSKKGWIWVEDSTQIIRDKEGNVIEYYGYINDLTHLKKLELQLEKANAENTSLMKAVSTSYLVSKADLQGNITYVNENFCQKSGYTSQELIGQNHNIVSHPKTSQVTFEQLWTTILSKKVWHGILQNKKKSGEAYFVDMTIKPILDENNEIKEFIAIRHEVTQLMQKHLTLKKSLRESRLLKIPNRFALFEKLKSKSNFVAAQIDIDAFHELNNFFGYETGDFILKELVSTIKNNVPKSIKIYHLQADKFVLLSKSIKPEEFTSICKSLQQKIHQKSFLSDKNEFSIRVTIVISSEPTTSLIRSLDMAHEYAKKHRNMLVTYCQECNYSAEYNKNLESLHKVKAAFEEDRVVPFYQALYNNRTDRIEKYEVLARMIEKDGSVLSPFYFLDSVYKAKLNQRLTKVIIRKSFEYFKESPYEFSINLALSDMLNQELVIFILEQLEKFPAPQRVVFEILESEGIENFDLVSEFISSIKAFGSKIAIDDFGSGYSNFENLIKLDADFIKIDGSLIKELEKKNDAYDVIDAICSFARKKGIKTIAEFVSSEALMLKVKQLDIDFSQGYYIHKPSARIFEKTLM